MNPRLTSGPLLGPPERRWLPRALRVVGAGLLGGVLAVAAGLMLHDVAVGDVWEVHTIEVTGNTHASDAALRHLADVRAGQHLAAVDLQRTVQSVVQHPWVRRAEARRIFPSTISIVVEEHEPRLLLALDELWYVDAGGLPFKRARAGSLDFPVLTGLDPALAEDHPRVARAVIRRGLDILDAAEGHPVADPARLSELRFDGQVGFTLVLRSGTELVVGFDQPGERLDRLDRLVAVGLDPTVPQRIDLDAGSVAIATPLPDPLADPA